MDALLQRLETRIRKLVERCEQLEGDNADLRQYTESLAREKDALLTKNRLAVSQIEGMISHLESRSTS